MKFTPLRIQIFASEEFEIYSYLNATNNTDVERYGIPAVHYFGSYQNYTMMAITLLDAEFNKKFEDGLFDGADALIVMQQFVSSTSSRYIVC